MKSFKKYLQEEFETEFKELTDTDTKHDRLHDLSAMTVRRNSPEHRGNSGSFGFVEPTKNDPHMVTKRPHIATTLDITKNDAYFNYIKYIIDNKLAQKNPYFPRVYNVTVDKNKNEETVYQINLEKLTPITDLRPDELEALYSMNFRGSLDGISSNRLRLTAINDALIKAFQNPSTIVNNKEFSLAIIAIRNLKKNTFGALDISLQNVMIRRTPAGNQLVITDPLA